jgi:hypothetical protein
MSFWASPAVSGRAKSMLKAGTIFKSFLLYLKFTAESQNWMLSGIYLVAGTEIYHWGKSEICYFCGQIPDLPL